MGWGVPKGTCMFRMDDGLDARGQYRAPASTVGEIEGYATDKN